MKNGNNSSSHYPNLKPPTDPHLLKISKKRYEDMTDKEARDYSKWKIENLFPERLDNLRDVCKIDGITLDSSISSLVEIWEWFLRNIQYVSKTDEEIDSERMALPEHLRPAIKFDRVKFSEETFTMIYDLSIYYGGIVIRHHPGIYWNVVLKRKANFNYHKSVLSNSKSGMNLNTVNLVNVFALKVKDGEANRDALLDHYNMYKAAGVY